jgi:hypothetical protein
VTFLTRLSRELGTFTVLGPSQYDQQAQVPPLTAGPVVVFTYGDVLYGLRLADGHRMWSRAGSQDIAGMWRWHDLVVVLTRPGRTGLPVLTGLDASTGQHRWTLFLGADVYAFSPTADGGLALTLAGGGGVLEVADLSSGRVRWAVPLGSTGSSPVAVDGGAVLFADGTQLTSYDDRTGRVRWTEAPMPVTQVSLSGAQASGLVYLTGGVWQDAGRQPAQVLLGISAADGRVRWRLTVSTPGSLWAHPVDG